MMRGIVDMGRVRGWLACVGVVVVVSLCAVSTSAPGLALGAEAPRWAITSVSDPLTA